MVTSSSDAVNPIAGFRRFGSVSRAFDRHEIERNADDFCILSDEPAFFVVVVIVGASQSTARDLLAQQLCGERPVSEDVGDGARVPSFGEHLH